MRLPWWLYDYRVLPLGSADVLTAVGRAAEPSGNLLETDSFNLIFRLLEPEQTYSFTCSVISLCLFSNIRMLTQSHL